MPSSQIRLLVICKTLDVGGAERLVVDSAARWGGPIEVAWLSGRGELSHELARSNIRVHDLSSHGRITPSSVYKLWKLLRSGRFDLVHAHLPIAAVLVRLLHGDLPVVYSEHNVWEVYSLPTRLLNRMTFSANRAVIAVSVDVLASIRRGWTADAPPTFAIPNGIEPVRADRSAGLALRRLAGVSDDTILILNIGNLFCRKGQDVLVKSSRLIQTKQAYAIWIAGEGTFRETLEEEISSLAEPKNVRLLGRRRDIAELLAAADVFVMPSRFEGLPVALLEAMSAGLPIVATAVGGMPDALQNGAGIIVPADDQESLAEELSRLLDAPGRRAELGRRASEEVAARFSASAMDSAVREVYARAIGWNS